MFKKTFKTCMLLLWMELIWILEVLYWTFGPRFCEFCGKEGDSTIIMLNSMGLLNIKVLMLVDLKWPFVNSVEKLVIEGISSVVCIH
jgi:hypothetical protein